MRKFTTLIKTVILGLFLSLGVGVLFAQWTGPTEPFSGGNTPAPLNIGSDLQTKAGSLWAGFIGSDGAGYVDGNFEVGNTITIGGGSPAAGKVLTAQDATGLAAWSDVSSSGSLSCVRRQQTASASTLTSSCQGGEVAIGGGGDCALGTLVQSGPDSSLSQWQITCSSSGIITAQAVCCSL